jgi:hypothetical protein
MLNSSIVKKIEDFIYSKPRSIQEIAEHIGKNWRTADRYIDEITKSYGTISTRVFREGTRGALKIVFWTSIEKVSHSIFQERLEQEIMTAKRKEDFSAFNIFQFIDDKNKKVEIKNEEVENIQEYSDILNSAKKQILFFSGNLSFINLKNKKIEFYDVLEGLIKNGISIKILCRVDLEGKENIEKALSLNTKHGKQLIDIRHDENPIRAALIDNKLIRIKEIKESTGKLHELNKRRFIYYTIKDKEWAEWLSRIFWKKFNKSIDVNKRLLELSKLK